MPTWGQKRRQKLRAIYGDQCYHCKTVLRFDSHKFKNSATIEHLVPAYATPNWKKSDKLEGLRLACRKCNNERAKIERVEFIVFAKRQIEMLEYKLNNPANPLTPKAEEQLVKNLRALKAKYGDKITSSQQSNMGICQFSSESGHSYR